MADHQESVMILTFTISFQIQINSTSATQICNVKYLLSECYSVRSFNKMLVNPDAKSFSILHCNIRSLSQNVNLLEELLCSLDSKLDIH